MLIGLLSGAEQLLHAVSGQLVGDVIEGGVDDADGISLRL